MELEGKKGLFVKGQSGRTWNVGTVCLRLSVLTGFRGYFVPKKAVLGTKCADLGGHLPTLRPRPGVPPVNFLPKTWIWQGHHLGFRMARAE